MDKQLLGISSDYLLCSLGLTTAAALSALLNAALSHDTITRFRAGSGFTCAALWELVKPWRRQIQAQEAVLVIEESLQEKACAEESERLCWQGEPWTLSGIKLTCFAAISKVQEDRQPFERQKVIPDNVYCFGRHVQGVRFLTALPAGAGDRASCRRRRPRFLQAQETALPAGAGDRASCRRRRPRFLQAQETALPAAFARLKKALWEIHKKTGTPKRVWPNTKNDDFRARACLTNTIS